jgi:hypothetical protein
MNKFLIFLLLVAAVSLNAQVTITPIPEQCINNPVIRLNASPMGGTWAGQGITNANTGDFLPAIAGVGVTKVKYTYNNVSDSIFVTVNAKPNVLLQDKHRCEGDAPAIFFAGNGYTTYNWNNGMSYASNLYTSSAGVHTVVVTNVNGCKDTSSASLINNPNPLVDLGPDIVTCAGHPIQLDAGTGFQSYFWGQAGSGTSQTVTANSAGTYFVVVSDANGCKDSDVVVVIHQSVPIVDLGPDKTACVNEVVQLDAGAGFASYYWSWGGSTGQTANLQVNSKQQGCTIVRVDDGSGCAALDTICISFVDCDSINKVKGTVFNDLNQNGTQDNGELGLKNVPVYAQTANYYSMTTTDVFGNYSVNTFETGTATVYIQLPYNSQLISPSSPAYHSISISAMNDSVVGKNFAVHFLPDIHDVKVDLSTNLARPGFQTICNAYVYNKGTVTEKNISLDLAYDNILTPSASSIPYSNANNILTFAIDSIKAGESKLVSVSFNVAQGANHLGHQLDYFGDVSLLTNDVYLSDNKDTCFRIITGSYDPNMKESALGEGNISPSTKEIEYTIHFQNTGTDTAFTVVVKDSLNKSVFDYKEVEMLCASHKYTYSIDTAGVIAFTFNDILLVDSTTNEPASHGFVKFKVKLNQGLGLGTVLKNKGYIYFDFNAPIITNEATNTLSNSVGVNEISNLNFKVFPNPSNDKITLMASSASLYSVEVYDVLGKRVYVQSNLQNAHVVNVSSFEKGIYFVRILQDGKQQVEKIIVQ